MRCSVAAVFAVLLLVGCGGSGGNDEVEPPSEPARIVAENPFGVSEVDLVALKEALDLPADADPAAPPPGEAGSRFASTARVVLPFCHGEDPPEPIDEAIRQAVDCAQIRIAAAPADVGVWSLTVMRTEQPFDEIAASLTEAGYARQGRMLNYVEGTEPMRYLEVVADEEDESLIALARDRTAGFAALGEGPAEPESRPDLRALAALPAAPARTAWVGDGECITAYALADRVEDQRGELVVQLGEDAGEARVEGFTLASHEGFADRSAAPDLFDFDQPEVTESSLHVGFAPREGEVDEVGVVAAFGGLAFAVPYECRTP